MVIGRKVVKRELMTQTVSKRTKCGYSTRVSKLKDEEKMKN